jgi:superfamily II DNA or RNA helicase
MLRRDVISGDGSRLLGTVWEAVVLDEAHLIKNPAAATTKAVGALQCKHRIALSGTPVQNQVRSMPIGRDANRALLMENISEYNRWRSCGAL